MISEALGTYPMTCARVRRQFARGGIDAVLNRKQRATPPVSRIFDGEKEARLIGLFATCREPREMDAALVGKQSRRIEHRGSCER
jgi:hypothetical protein